MTKKLLPVISIFVFALGVASTSETVRKMLFKGYDLALKDRTFTLGDARFELGGDWVVQSKGNKQVTLQLAGLVDDSRLVTMFLKDKTFAPCKAVGEKVEIAGIEVERCKLKIPDQDKIVYVHDLESFNVFLYSMDESVSDSLISNL